MTVRTADGGLLARVPLQVDQAAVSFRNSSHGTPAVERYQVGPDGPAELVEITADQVAVREDHHAVPDAPRLPPGSLPVSVRRRVSENPTVLLPIEETK